MKNLCFRHVFLHEILIKPESCCVLSDKTKTSVLCAYVGASSYLFGVILYRKTF